MVSGQSSDAVGGREGADGTIRRNDWNLTDTDLRSSAFHDYSKPPRSDFSAKIISHGDRRPNAYDAQTRIGYKNCRDCTVGLSLSP